MVFATEKKKKNEQVCESNLFGLEEKTASFTAYPLLAKSRQRRYVLERRRRQLAS